MHQLLKTFPLMTPELDSVLSRSLLDLQGCFCRRWHCHPENKGHVTIVMLTEGLHLYSNGSLITFFLPCLDDNLVIYMHESNRAFWSPSPAFSPSSFPASQLSVFPTCLLCRMRTASFEHSGFYKKLADINAKIPDLLLVLVIYSTVKVKNLHFM